MAIEPSVPLRVMFAPFPLPLGVTWTCSVSTSVASERAPQARQYCGRTLVALMYWLPHVALANLLDNEKAVLKFMEAFGPLFSSRDYLRTNGDPRSLLPLRPNESVHELLKEHPTADFYYYGTSFVYQQRDILRKAWEGDRAAIESMRQHAAANVTSQWKFHHGRIDITAPDAWTVVCVLFLIDHESGNTVICKNDEDCPAPYFVRKRRTQKFCESGPCVAHGQRLRSKKWWGEHGNEWREQAQKKSSRKGAG
jgi:hypothetical protein